MNELELWGKARRETQVVTNAKVVERASSGREGAGDVRSPLVMSELVPEVICFQPV